MKYIISENKLDSIIRKYIEKYFDLDNIHWEQMEDVFGDENDAIEFFRGRYTDDDTIFRLYGPTYWSNDNDFRKNLSPLLMIEDENFTKEMTDMFNQRWIPIFKEWFNENFPDTKAKTIDFY